MSAADRLAQIEARALAPWSVEGVGRSLADVVDLVAGYRAVLDLHAGCPYDHGIDHFGRSLVGACPTVRAITEALTP